MSDYTIDEASRMSGISVRSLRNYVHQYADFLELKRGPYNSLLFSDSDLEVLVKVKSLLRDNLTRKQICDALEREKDEPTMQVTKNAVTPANEAPVLLPILKKIDTVLTDLLEENQKLHSRLADVEEQLARSRAALPATTIPSIKATTWTPSGLGLPVPYFVLAAKDGCVAIAKSFWRTFVGR